ncbi:uncharacterized protein B0T15DRAFT_116098 [Chaetomium strumarium]|uniref:Secreted protein n=1 Tax=Chaetomium strumarium TaxID=1170767 RepID=A0AAJ0M4N4_9PEZI|nr:hypothetical protein B0T15DRAFT_116098 [Chaetomium strumarium]
MLETGCLCLVISLLPEMFQPAAAAAFHSAVNDGSTFLIICLIFRSNHSPDRANGNGEQADPFPQFSGESDNTTPWHGSFLEQGET